MPPFVHRERANHQDKCREQSEDVSPHQRLPSPCLFRDLEVHVGEIACRRRFRRDDLPDLVLLQNLIDLGERQIERITDGVDCFVLEGTDR